LGRELKWKWLFFFIGLMVMSLGVSMIIKGKAIGVSAWDVLHVALFHHIGLTVGTWSILTGVVIVGSTSLYLKEWPKLATIINMLLCGTFIDFFNWILPNSTGLIVDYIYFMLGVIVLGIGCALYISPNLGAGPRDTLMIIISEKFSLSIGNARLLMEAFIAGIGWLLGGPIGLGTIIIAFFTGYIVQSALPFFRNMLHTKLNESVTNNVFPSQKTDKLAKES